MSRKRTVCTAAFKSRLILEVLKNEKPLTEIASSHYYQKTSNSYKLKIKDKIIDIFEYIPIYGAAKVHQQLLATPSPNF